MPSPLKIVWLLQRAPQLSPTDFQRWWLEDHVPLARVAPGLERYVVNLPVERDDLPGRPQQATTWDGVAEQWFADEAAVRRAYDRARARRIRADTLAHVARLERVIVREREILPPRG